MSKINLGTCEVNWKASGESVWLDLGETIDGENAVLELSEEFASFKVTQYPGPYSKISKGIVGTVTMSILLDLAKLPLLSSNYATNGTSGETEITGTAGNAAIEGELHLHPSAVVDESYDVYCFRAIPTIVVSSDYGIDESKNAKVQITFDLSPATTGADTGFPCVIGRAKA